MDEKNYYTLEIDLNVLNHLGLNLYSNVPAVLSELVANAWDADATTVDISIEESAQGKMITIHDNGCGMDDNDLDKKFLTVGYQKRANQDKDRTPIRKRQVMGRKGIGKLSVFSIAEYIQVFTKKKNEDMLGLELDLQHIQQAIEQSTPYHPKPLEPQAKLVIKDHGTTIVLDRLKKRVNSTLDSNLRKRVARRFDIFSDKFRVKIDDKEITLEDRDYLSKLEYALIYGDFSTERFSKNLPHETRENSADGGYSVTGWIGLMEDSGALQDGVDNLNKISILSRGKVALEDILDRFGEGGLYTKYVIGEIRADFLDETTEEDISTSSRQNFVQDDQRFQSLEEFIQRELKYIGLQRSKIKAKAGVEKALEIPAIQNWHKSLKGDTKKAAEKLFGRINQIATDKEHRKTLYKHGVLAFEHLQYKEKLAELEILDINNLDVMVKLFSELDDIEASWYYQITRGRLDVIETLTKYLEDNVLEEVIKKHICKHLWLLDPSWDRATELPIMERTIASKFKEVSEKLTDEEKKGRLDIRYKKIAGKHVIIELKRGSITTSSFSLGAQVDKYIQALQKQLEANNEKNAAIEAICLVGKSLQDWDTPERKRVSEQSLSARNIRVVTYQQLVRDAEISYRSYLEKQSEKGRIKTLLDEIDKYSATDLSASA